MFSLDVLALTVSFLQSTMTHQSICTFIVTGKVGTIVARDPGERQSKSESRCLPECTKDSKQIFQGIFLSFFYLSWMLYHQNDVTLLNEEAQQGWAGPLELVLHLPFAVRSR